MQYPTPTNFSQLAVYNTQKQVQLLVQEIYPKLFQQLQSLNDALSIWTRERNDSPAAALLLKINEELVQLYRKEEFELYPFLLQLEAAGKQSDCCSPFKKVKVHYSAVLTAGAQLQQILALQDTAVPDTDAGQALDRFLQKLISVQIHKEKYVLAPYRNCTGSCKTISND